MAWTIRAHSSCPSEGREYVQLSFDSVAVGADCASGDPALLQRIEELIRADLVMQKVDVCVGPMKPYSAPLASLDIESGCAQPTQVHLRLLDNVTQKELFRRISLAGLPRDTYAMAIAVGAVELLRASWAETRLVGVPATQGAYPGAVEKVLAQDPRGPTTHFALGMGVVGEGFSGGMRQLGMDAELTAFVSKRVSMLARLGWRTARSLSSRHGRVSADGWLSGVGVSYLIAQPSPRVELRAEGRIDGMWLSFSSVAEGNAVATPDSGLTMWSSIGLESAVRVLDNAWIDTAMAAGFVVLPVVATDAGQQVMGVEGAYVAARLGMKVHF